MRKNWKNNIITVMVMLFMVIMSGGVARAESFKQEATSGTISVSITYDINEDGKTVTLSGCKITASDTITMTLPATVTNNGVTYLVTALDDTAFYVEELLGSITIPASVKSIGDKCFYDCENLYSVTFSGNGLERIGERAFFGCNLQSFTFPNTVQEVGECIFGYAQFSSITIPKSITTFGQGMFYASNKLTTAVFEEGCTKVPEGMFSGCDKLKSVTLASTITTIEDSAFSHGGTITELIFPENLTTIEGYAFYETNIGKLVVLADTLTVGTQAFSGTDIDELHCSKRCPLYTRYKDDSGTKLVITGTYMADEAITLDFGGTYQLQVTNPVGATTWTSSNPSIATVSADGLVTGVGTGKAVITAANNGVTMQCDVTVGKFQLNKTKVTIGAGATYQLKATKGVIVQWNTSNKKVATVSDKGVVTAKKNGKVKITAKAAGTTLTCNVTVKTNERKNLEKYSKNPAKYVVNACGFGFSSIKRDKSGNYVISGHFLNTYGSRGRVIKNVTFIVYKDGKQIAKQKFKTMKVNAPAQSMKPIKITIKKKYITKKTTDLRTGKIRIKVSGGRLFG